MAEVIRSIAKYSSSVIIVAFVLAFGLHWAQRPRPKESPLMAGESLPPNLLPSVARFLVIAVSEKCTYSQSSVAFHRRVIDAAHRAGIPIVLAIDEGGFGFNGLEESLRPNDQAVKIRLRSLRISGTPTIVLIDQGKVTGRWIGVLDSNQEDSMLTRLDGVWHTLSKIKVGQKGEVGEVVRVSSSEIVQRLRNAFVLDIRSRDDYAALSYHDGRINIPGDELNFRMQFELPNHDPEIVIDCSGAEEMKCRLAAIVLSRGGFGSVWLYDLGAQGVACGSTPTAE